MIFAKTTVLLNWCMINKLWLLGLGVCSFVACNKQKKPEANPLPEAFPLELMDLYRKARGFIKHNPDSVLFYFSKLEQRSKTMNSAYGIGLALSARGDFIIDNGDTEQALSLYEEALPYYRKSRNGNAVAGLYTNLGSAYNLQGNYQKARKYYQLALHHFLTYHPRNKNIGLVYGNLSDLYLNIGDYTKALYYVEQAEQFFSRNMVYPTPFTEAMVLINKGDAYARLHRYQEAYATLQECLRVVEKKEVREVEPAVLSILGELMLLQNKNKEAIAYLEKAIENQAKNVYYAYIFPRYKLGVGYYRLGEYQKAKNILEEAFKKTAQTGQLNESINARATLALVFEALDDYKNAFEQQQIVIKLRDSLMNKEKINAIREMEIKFETAQKDKEIAEKKLQISRQENKLNRKNVWIGGISCGTLLLAVFFVSRSRINKQREQGHNKQIQILQQQQDILKQELEINYLKAVVQGEEKERVRIARDLHDGIVSQLLGVRLHFKGALKNSGDKIPNYIDFENTLAYLDNTTKELRKTAHNLMPEDVLQSGLIVALHSFCKKMEDASAVKIYLQTYGTYQRMDPDVELSLYRIVQELVQNALKHAAASYILVQLDVQDSILSIIVEDNGKGFDQNIEQQGMGLKNVYNRTKTLQGTIDIISKPDTGTTINMEFMIEPKRA